MRLLLATMSLCQLSAFSRRRSPPPSRLLSHLTDAIAEHAFCSIRDWLRADFDRASQFLPREVLGAHFCDVKPERCSNPYLIAVSPSCLSLLRLPEDSSADPDFPSIFSGNKLIPGLDAPYVTNYGCHRCVIYSVSLLILC